MSILKANRIENLTTTDGGINVNNAGKVGVNQSSPSQMLHVEDSGSNVYVRVTETGNTGIDFGQATNGNGVINLRDNADIQILTNGVEELRVLAAGGLTFNGDTAAANALDDYETGTWTPDILGGTSNPSLTYSSRSGAYEKIGNLVHASFFMQVSAVSSQGSGQFQIHGLPFNSVSSPLGASEVPAVCLQTEPFQDGDGDHRDQTFRTTGSNSFLLATYKDQSSGGAAVPSNAAANIGTGYLIGHITYRTNS